jgi:[ribosomal protein S5]-alanine N-acetyltransferase
MKTSRKEFPTLPQFVGKSIYLKPAGPDDIFNARVWINKYDPQIFWASLMPAVTPSEAAEQFKKTERSVDEQVYAIVRCDDDMLVGTIGYHNLNMQNRSAELRIVVDPDEQRKGHGVEAVRILTRHLFKQRGLNKVYVEISEANHAAAAFFEKRFPFRRDAALRQHYFMSGTFHDGYIYSLLALDLDW